MKITKLAPDYFFLRTDDGLRLEFTEAFTGTFTADATGPQVSLHYEGADIAILYKLDVFVDACQEAGVDLCPTCKSVLNAGCDGHHNV